MSLELPTLLQRYQLDSSQAVSGARTGAGALSTLGGAFRSLRGLIEAAGVSLGAFRMGSFLKQSVQEASSAQQSLKTVTTLFGPSAKEIVNWGQSNAASFGIAESAALQYAQQLGTVLKGFGFIPKAAADMSLSLEKVAGDVQVFRHQDPSQVISAFQAGLYGATRGLRQYGIDVSQTSIQQTALSLGITTATKTWDAQTKAQVYYALIMRGTTAEVGAASARQHDLAVESKVLSAEMQNLRDRIGTALLPIMSAFIGLIVRDAVPALETFVTWITTAGSWVWSKFAQPLEKAFTTVKVLIDGFIIGITHPNINVDPLGWIAKSVVGAGEIVRKVVDDVRTAISALFAGFSGSGTDKFVATWQKDFVRVGQIVRDVVDAIKSAWSHVGPILQPVFDLIGKFLGTSAGKAAAAATGFTILGASLATIVGGPIYEGLVGLANILSFVTSAIALLPFAAGAWIAGIALMVGAVIYFYKTSATFRDELHRLLAIFETEWVPKIENAGRVLRDGFIRAVEDVGPPLLRFGSAIARDILPALKLVGDFISRNITPIMIGFGILLGAIITPAILSGLAALGGVFVSMGASIAGLFSPLTFVIGGIALLAAGAIYAYQHFKSFRDITGEVVGYVVTLGQSLAREVVPAFHIVASLLTGAVLPALATLATTVVRDALPVLRDIGTLIVDRIVPGFIQLATGAAPIVVAAFKSLVSFGLLALGALHGVAEILINDLIPAALGFGGFLARNLLPPLAELAQLLASHLVPVLIALGAAFIAIQVSGFVVSLLGAVAAVVDLVGALSGLAEVVGVVGTVAEFAPGLALLANPVTAVVAGIIALGAAFVYAYAHFKSFRDEVNGLVGALAPLAKISFASMIDSLKQLGDFWKGHWAEIVTVVHSAMEAIGIVLAVAVVLWDTFGKDVLASVRNAFEFIAGIVKGTLDIVLGTIGVFLDLLTGKWGKAWHDLGQVVKGAWEIVAAQVRYGVKQLFVGFDTAKDAAGLFGRALVAVMTEVGKQSARALTDGVELELKTLYLQFVRIPIDIAKSIPRGVGSLFDVGRSFVQSLLDGAKTAFVGTLAWFTGLPGAIRGAVHDPRDLATVGHNFVASLLSGAQSVFGDVLHWFASAPKFLRDAVGDTRDLFVSVGTSMITGLLSGVTSAFGTVVSWFEHVPGYVEAALGDLGKLLYRAGQDITRGLYEGLLFGFKVVIFAVAGIPILLVEALVGLAVLMVKVGSAAVAGLLKGITVAAVHLYKWFTALPKQITTALGDATGWLLRVGTEVINGLTRGVVLGWGALEKWFAALPGNIVALLGDASTWLLTSGVSALNGFLTGAVKGFVAVATWLHHVPGYIEGALASAGSWLVHVGADAIGGLQHGATAAFAAVSSWLHGLPARVRSAVGDAGTWLLQVGHAVIDGLFNGMKDAWRGVTGWLGHIGGDIVKFIKNPLSIFSPSRVMHEVGLNTMLGLENGLRAGWTGVVGAVSTMNVAKVFPSTPIPVPVIPAPVAATAPGATPHRGEPEAAFSNTSIDAQTGALIRQSSRLADLQNEQRGVASSALNLEQAQQSVKQATDDYNTALATYHDKNAPAVIQAQIAMSQAQLDAAQAMQDGSAAAKTFAADLATNNGKVALSGVAAQKFRDDLVTLASQFPAMRGPILDYVHSTLGAIPPTVTTTPHVITTAAVKNIAAYVYGLKGIPPNKITTSQFDAVRASLLVQGYSIIVGKIPKTTNTNVTVTGVDAAIHAMTTLKNTVLKLDPGFNLNILAGEQHGGSTGPHAAFGNTNLPADKPVVIGEQGPEIFWPKVPGRIIPAPETRRTLDAIKRPVPITRPTISVPQITNALVEYKPPPPALTDAGGALSAVALKRLSDNIADASRPAQRPATRAEQASTNVTYDVDVYPQDHTLTERGLISELRKAERHGTLHSASGVPRRVTGGNR